jgi:hypothetical protein
MIEELWMYSAADNKCCPGLTALAVEPPGLYSLGLQCSDDVKVGNRKAPIYNDRLFELTGCTQEPIRAPRRD